MPVKTLPKSLYPFFWHFMRQQWKWLLAMQIFFFAWALDHTLWPYVLMLVIDTLVNFEGDRSHIWAALAYPVAFGTSLWVAIELMFRGGGFLYAYVIPRIESAVRMSMFDYVQRHSYNYFSTHFAGGIANKISDMTDSMTRVLQMVMTLFIPVLLAMVIAVMMFASVNVTFALILATWLAVHIAICLYFGRRCDKYSHEHADARTTLSGKIVDSLTNSLNFRLFARNKFENEYLATYQNREQLLNRKSLIYVEKMKVAFGINSFLGAGIGVNWYMLYSWQQGYITTGEVVLIFNMAWNITMMAWIAGLELPNLFKEIGICKQALSVIQDPHDVVDDVKAAPLKMHQGKIEFENVSFHYTPNRNIFQDKNIVIDAGTKVGLVGYSGSGKSTFVHLILRYYDVEQGCIKIDGQDIATVTQDSLRDQIAMIPQDTSLFHRSLMENIRYGRLGASDDEVVEAAKKAHCHEFIEKLSEKYHTTAGERGVRLSGGQRQRIAIARAILKNSPILILDEATSSLDSVTEKSIQDGMGNLMDNKTCIVIAHRLSTLCGMDRLLVFKDGHIVEEGTHEELIQADGHYAYMWNMQAGGFLPDNPV